MMKVFKFYAIVVFSLLFAAAGVQADMDDGLVSYYPFEGDSSDVVGGYHGIDDGEVIYEAGRVGLGVRFSGDEEIFVDAAPGLEAWTISFWVYIDTPPMPNYAYAVVGKLPQDNGDDSDYYNYGFYYHVNRPSNWQYQSCGSDYEHALSSGGPLAYRTWLHVTSTLDASGGHKFYLNGALRNQVFNQIHPCANDAPLTIGGVTDSLTNMFKGMVDELRIYDRALDPAEVAAVYGHNEVFTVSSDEPECPEPDFAALLEEEVGQLGLDDDATGAVHAYPNVIRPKWRGDHMRTVLLEGYVANKLAALTLDTPDVFSAVFVLIDGDRHDIVLTGGSGFEQEVAVPAVPGTELTVGLYAVDPAGNVSLVDKTRIQVTGQHPCDRLEILENRMAKLESQKAKFKKKYRRFYRFKAYRLEKQISSLNKKIVYVREFCESLK